LAQSTQLQFSQNFSILKQSQYNFKHFDFLQLHLITIDEEDEIFGLFIGKDEEVDEV
jgi:hypothetical protein